MLSALFSVALLAASANSLVLPHRRDLDLDEASSAPATYAQGFLESYSAYHDRFDSYGCYESRGTAFFDQCCHPRLAADSENADTDASCTAAATTQAQSLTSVSTEEDIDDEECSDEDYEYEDTAASASVEAYVPEVTYAAEPATTYAAEPATTYAAEPVASYVPETTETPATSEAPVVEVPVATSTEEAPAAETTAADSGSVPTEGGLTGIATYYFQNGVRGACGDIHGDSDAIVAIPPSVWGDANSKSANCGKTVTLINTNNGQQTQALIADSCPTCEGDGIDLSHGLFTSLAAESDGIFPIRWFIN